jgi:hypothetical protein
MPLLSALSLSGDRAAAPKDLEIRPKQVKAWLESLPMAQSVDAARRLLAHAAGVNKAKVDADSRFQILDAYRTPLTVILDELDAVYSKAPVPLGPRAREALMLARELGLEVATGYRIGLADVGGKLIGFGAKKLRPLLALRAIEYLNAVMRACYKAYAPVPEGIWKELHRLYLLAEKEAIAAEAADPETKATVADAYGEALLLALTDPYRLVPGEVDKIIGQIRGARGLTWLGQTRPATRSNGHFLVPCDTDRPPKPMLSANDDAGGPNWRLFDANPVVDRLQARKKAMETGNVSATTSKSLGPDGLALIGRLILLWGEPPKRAHRRDPMETSVVISAGLRSVSHYVSLDPELNAQAEADALKKGITMPLIVLPTDEISKKEHPVHNWDVVNQSTGGVKLRRVHESIPAINVGEVVGIKFAGKRGWTIGVARWITLLDEGGMEFGVQFLSSEASMVWVQPTITSSPQAKASLRLTDDPADEALITPPNTFSDMREFEVRSEANTSRVRAAGLIEKTGRFELFHVSPS